MTRAETEDRIFARFDGFAGRSLAGLCGDLLAEQIRGWPDLAAGHEALAAARLRDMPCPGFSVRVQFNPKRITSATAKVDPESIRKRTCFLCRENLPPPQKGILYRQDYLVLCNPAPIFPRHYTVSSRRHIPQAIEDHLDVLLRLAEDFSGAATVLYNGPRSGASAPDHFHFQVFPTGTLPVESALDEKERKKLIRRFDDASSFRGMNLGRTVLIVEGRDSRGVSDLMLAVIDGMKKILREPGEPMMNILGSHGKGGWRVLIFPRGRHRPGVFDRDGDEQILISPGAVDMGGLIITPREKDFRILDCEMVQAVFRDVSWDETRTADLVRALRGKPPRRLKHSQIPAKEKEARP
jgi:hypothetical protein